MALLQEIQVPLLAVNDTILTVAELSFATGEFVKKGDVIMVLETSKTTYDVEAEGEGFIQYLCEAGNDYEVNTTIARIYSEKDEAAAALAARQTGSSANGRPMARAMASAPPAARPQVWDWAGETLFSDQALRMIQTAGLDRSVFAGRDLVTVTDVQEYLEAGAAPASGMASAPGGTSASRAASGMASAPGVAPPGKSPVLPVDPARVVVEKLRSAKKREIEYLASVQAPGLTSTINTFVETDGIFTHINSGLRYLRDSLLPVIIYESARLLADYPFLNGYFTGESAAFYKEINPGFAVDIDKGLKVLKIGRAGHKTIREIEDEILQLSGQYLDDTLQIDQLTDITFTITDLSSEGVAFFRPLINQMNSAILGVSAIDEKLQRCTLSLTFDHRMTEGKPAARFLRELKERLESYRPPETPKFADISCFKCYKTLKEDLSGAGFARCITPEGSEGYVCQSCLKGF